MADQAELKLYLARHRLVRRDGTGSDDATRILTTLFGCSLDEARAAVAGVLRANDGAT